MLYITRTLIRRIPGAVIKMVPLPVPEVLSGIGATEEAGAFCIRNGFKKVLLVTDETLYGLGVHEKVEMSLQKNHVEFSVFREISSEPNLAIIDAGRKALEESGADAIIALGGGAVMDACKMIASGGRLKKRRSRALLRKFLFVKGKTLPMLSIPTTAGTGAEMTVGAVVTDDKGRKVSSVIVGLDVRGVILDGGLTLKLPLHVTASCGIDALSHGLEGTVASVRVADEDMEKSMQCVKLVLENLPVLLREPQNEEARQNMCLAAHYGGHAINKQLAGYVHAFAHTIGAKYHIPHGEAIALSLMPVMEIQKEKCMDRLAALSRFTGFPDETEDDAAASERLLEALRELIGLCAFKNRISSIPKADYRSIAHAVAMDSINYSPPVVLTNGQIFAVLDRLNESFGTDCPA